MKPAEKKVCCKFCGRPLRGHLSRKLGSGVVCFVRAALERPRRWSRAEIAATARDLFLTEPTTRRS